VRGERLTAAFTALAWGLVVAVAAYALLRAQQAVRGPGPDPATVVWSPHAGFFWRSWTSMYIGGIAAFAAWLLAQGRVEATARALVPGVLGAAGLLALVSLLSP
jgi:hypothetical protein